MSYSAIPGKGHAGYLRLEEVIKKAKLKFLKNLFELSNSSILVNGMPVQGLKVIEKM